MIFNNQQIESLRTVYFDQHKMFYKYSFRVYYLVIYEDEHGMNLMEGLFTYPEVLIEKNKIRRLNPHCRIHIENETEKCNCVLQ
jgi:hypothetical protein